MASRASRALSSELLPPIGTTHTGNPSAASERATTQPSPPLLPGPTATTVPWRSAVGNRVVITAHILSGLLAASAGILLVSRLGSAHPDVGKDWMLASFAAPIIGGTRLAGGKVSIVGAVLGAILLALIADGLIFLKIDIYWNTLIQGLIILGAVGLDRLRMISAEHLERQRR